jgi:2-keto-myo-inositol isomerase
MEFALNHMVAPQLRYPEFLKLATSLGIGRIEIRNDIAHNAILDGTSPDAIRQSAEAANIKILTINALQRFNEWTPERENEARQLAGYAAACGAAAVVLCPVNDLAFQPEKEVRLNGLRQALTALKPILDEAGLKGFVEPLGFAECSQRLKREAIDAIIDSGGTETYRLVHDTFHHHVAGEQAFFPEWTGLVHISGVIDPAVPTSEMRDKHRVLVDSHDRIDNTGQIKTLLKSGYTGVFSFEPFAASVHASANITQALKSSISSIQSSLQTAAA